MRGIFIACVAACGLVQAAPARDWPRAGGFDIGEGADYCFLSSEYQGDGDTELMVSLKTDGTAMVVVQNYNWTAKEGERYDDISVHLSTANYGGGTALGVSNDGRHGFGTKVPGKFLDGLAASTYLHVYKGDAVVDRLDLKGSGAAVAMVRRCVATVKAEADAEERKRRRFADIPKDPFAAPQ